MWSLSDFTSAMSGEPATIVAKAASTLKVRDLFKITLTRWTSDDSLTKTPLEETLRPAACARSAEAKKTNAAPTTITPKARSLAPALPELRPPLIPFPLAAILLAAAPECTPSGLPTVQPVAELTI